MNANFLLTLPRLRPAAVLCLLAIVSLPSADLRAQSAAAVERATADTAESSAPSVQEGTGPANVDAAAAQTEEEPFDISRPLLAMSVGVAVVLLLMIGLKVHAFVALILGALVISCFVPLDIVGFAKTPEPHVIRSEDGSPVEIVNRVTNSLGNAVSGIGVLIAMAAIIGKCMLVSGAADRIVKSALAVLGEKRAALAMMASGFVLSIPVFFDTVFYLLVPLARSLYRSTGKNYLLYLAAIAAGGAITHTLVPPTPGPLLVANTLKVDIGVVMLIGLAIGAPSAVVGLLAAVWLNRVMPVPMRPMTGGSGNSSETHSFTALPSLLMALVPVLLPVVLITIDTVYGAILGDDPSQAQQQLKGWLGLIGNPNLAMIIAALFSVYLCWKVQGHSLRQLADHVEDALLSGGVIILITAAGGAFGALLAMTEIQKGIEGLFQDSQSGGLIVILVAYGLAAALKVAQGSSTVAMIVASSLVASIALPLSSNGSLGFHMAYLVPVIGAGSLMGSWMNDSGFWVFAKMGVLTEGETLRSWTVLLCILSVAGLLFTLLLVSILPFPV
ncbi:MAG: gluconate permease [Planctomycetales bacterium]|nr:gluconate permease [Planctomycetales bacterium]